MQQHRTSWICSTVKKIKRCRRRTSSPHPCLQGISAKGCGVCLPPAWLHAHLFPSRTPIQRSCHPSPQSSYPWPSQWTTPCSIETIIQMKKLHTITWPSQWTTPCSIETIIQINKLHTITWPSQWTTPCSIETIVLLKKLHTINIILTPYIILPSYQHHTINNTFTNNNIHTNDISRQLLTAMSKCIWHDTHSEIWYITWMLHKQTVLLGMVCLEHDGVFGHVTTTAQRKCVIECSKHSQRINYLV